MTMNRLTMSAGVRYDNFSITIPEQTVGPTMFTPNRNITFPQAEGPKWHDLSPRLSLAVDLFGNGRTALKTSFNKYLGGEGSGGTFGIGVAPTTTLVNDVRRSFRDTNGNFFPDCDLTIPEANGECGRMRNADFGKAAGGLEFSDSILNGYGKRSYNWQIGRASCRERV